MSEHDDDAIDVEVVEGPTTAALATIPKPTQLDIIRPISSADQAVAVFEEYAKLRRTVVTDRDKQVIQGREFVTKSGWRKLAVIMGVTLEIRERHYERDLAGRIANAEVICRATAPNGRYADGLGLCDYRERCCPQAYGEPCTDKRNKHHHCEPGCSGFNHFSKPQHDIPATASTRAYNRACSDLFGFGEVSAEEIGDRGEPLEPDKVDAIVLALNSIEDEPQRKMVKHKFIENFGRPDGLTNGDLPAVEKWLRANGLAIPDAPATASAGGASDAPRGSESVSGGGDGAGSEVATSGPSAAPPATPAGDRSPTPEPAGSTSAAPSPSSRNTPPGAGRSTPPAKPKPSNPSQRQRLGMLCKELENDAKIRPGDKKEITAIISNERTTTTTELLYDEAVRMTACVQLLGSGDLELRDDEANSNVRKLVAITPKGMDWMRKLAEANGAEVQEVQHQ